MTIVAGIFSMLVWGRIVVLGDPAATAANIQSNAWLYRLGSLSDLLGVLCYVAVTLFIYELLKPVHRSVSLLAAFFSLVGSAVGAVGCVLMLAPQIALGGGQKFLSAFSEEQLQALAFLFVRWRAQTNNVGLVFFGLHCLLIGFLILRSTFLPRFVGVLMVIAGVGWLTFLWPPLASSFFPYNMAPGILGETVLTLWLLFAGVNVVRWNAQLQPAEV
jgi:hypothetical protein